MNQYEDALYLGSLATLIVVTGIAYTIVCIVLKKQSRNIMEHNESNRNRAGELRLLKEKRFLNDYLDRFYRSFCLCSWMDFTLFV